MNDVSVHLGKTLKQKSMFEAFLCSVDLSAFPGYGMHWFLEICSVAEKKKTHP